MHIITSTTAISWVVFFTLSILPLAVGRNLVPAKRAVTLETRSLWKRDLVPRNNVQLNYGLSTYHPASASVSFVAHTDRPILLLEDMDHLLDHVRCTEVSDQGAASVMELSFSSEDAFVEALELWDNLRTFAVATAHPICNADDERGAWMVDSVQGNTSSQTITLTARPVVWEGFGQSCRVQYGYTGRNTWDVREHLGLQKRQEVNNDTVYKFGVAPEIARLPLYPPNGTLAPSAALQGLDNLDLQLTCVDCGLTANVSVGTDFEINLGGNASCVPSATESCFGVNRAALNFTVDDIALSANLELFLGSQLNKAGNYSVLRLPFEPGFQFGTLVEIGPAIGLQLMWDFDVSADLNFTYGATAHFAEGAFAALSLVNGSGQWDPTFSSSWGQTGITQNPFRVNSGQFNITTTSALAPYIEVAFIIFGVGSAARVVSTAPKLNLNAALVENVDRQCNPAGPDSFETFSVAFQVGAGMELETFAHFEVDTGVFPASSGFPNFVDFPLTDVDLPLLPADGSNKTDCFVLVDDSTQNSTSTNTSTTVTGVPASTGTLFTAASAVPTWNIAGIESYLSAHGTLPTGVNYTQMAQATTVPSGIQQALMQAASSTSSASPSGGGSSSGGGSPSSGGSSTESSSGASLRVSIQHVLTALLMVIIVMVSY